jgi:hypothetical protein
MSAVHPLLADQYGRGLHVIVIGLDPHKASHMLAAVNAATGVVSGTHEAKSSLDGMQRALGWGRALGSERVWAIEDCRHVSGRMERFLVARGETAVRVAPKLMAGARRSARERGKSDVIDATAVARAAIREGVERLPAARLDEQALEIRLLLGYRRGPGGGDRCAPRRPAPGRRLRSARAARRCRSGRRRPSRRFSLAAVSGPQPMRRVWALMSRICSRDPHPRALRLPRQPPREPVQPHRPIQHTNRDPEITEEIVQIPAQAPLGV